MRHISTIIEALGGLLIFAGIPGALVAALAHLTTNH